MNLLLRSGAIAIFVASMSFASVAGASAGARRSAARARYRTGVYAGSTSTGSKLRFKVLAHSATNGCGASRSAHCFIGLKYPTVTMSCSNGEQIKGPFELPSSLISKSGRASYFQPLEEGALLVRFEVRLRKSGAKGVIRQAELYDNGEETVKCDSGVVKFTAKRIG